MRGPGAEGIERHRADLAVLEREAERLEVLASQRSGRFRAELTVVTLDGVRSAMPSDAALVEFVVYRPVDPKAPHEKGADAAHYAVYTLLPTGEIRWAELGDAAAIDAAAGRLREALREPTRRDVRRLSRTLDELVMRPVRRLVGPVRHLLVSPDGQLNLVPFAALVDERGRYLVETHDVSYLTSGRDLLRLAERRETGRSSIVVADPAFGNVPAAAETETRDPQTKAALRPSSGFARVSFPPLLFTVEEARTLSELLPEPTLLLGEAATEAALKHLHAPGLLHIATHGFFLSDAETRLLATRDVRLEPSTIPDEMSQANPLLRSGLALAGANARRSGDDDGVLTALEVAGLDLWGTEMVVLSACDTGVGEVEAGDGVYGLRRALVLAGAESQVMSLWAVDDRATRDLMIAYYRRLLGGEGRSAALREVQLRMLRRPATRHPFYWAAFIAAGEWAGLAQR